MAIISAEVESVGWVLRLVVSGGVGGFSDYALDPDGTPRLRVNASHSGFLQSGGQAVAGISAREILGMVPLRLPVDPADPSNLVIDEVDLGGGQRRVRIALSETIYATDTGLALDALAGWRTGEGAAAGIAVVNGSAVAAPKPIMRWAVQPFQFDKQPLFRLSLLVASHHPNGFAPVAGVKFTLTDGATTLTAWAMSLATDNSAGDSLRCYTVEVDASALNAGLLRADAEVYPWVGAMRTTDAAGTRSMAGLISTVQSNNAELPLVLANDPAGTRWGDVWVMVDPVNGSNVPNAAMVATSLAAAKAVPAAQKAANLAIAFQAIYLRNKSHPAANGQAASAARSYEGARIVIPAGVTPHGINNTTFGFQSSGVPLIIMGDPDDENPRANCILRSNATTGGGTRVSFYALENLTAEIGQTTLFASLGTGFCLMRNCEVRGKSGFETVNANIGQTAPAAGTWNHSIVQSRVWKTGFAMNQGTNHRYFLIRNTEHARTAGACVLVKNRFLGLGEDTTYSGAVNAGQGWGWGGTGAEDNFIAYCDYRATQALAYSVPIATAAEAGTPNPSVRRFAMLNNVFERVGAAPQSFFSVGEGVLSTISYNIIEGNTFAGERTNFFYNDPPVATVADTNTLTNQAFGNRVANNAFDWNPNKQDTFFDSSTLAVRAAAGVPNPSGYRPHLVDCWSDHMGVGREGNYDSASSPGFSAAFPLWFHGLRSEQASPPTAAGYVANRSNSGDGLGLGDYTPVSGSPLLGRVVRGQSDLDFAGTARVVGGAAGAFELAGTAPEVALLPEDARHDQLSGSPGLGGAVSLTPASAFHGYGGFDPLLAVLLGLAPAQGWLMVSGADALVGVRLDLAPAQSGPVMLATSTLLNFGTLTLMASDGRIVISGAEAALTLSQAGADVRARLLRVGAEQRIFFARPG